MLHEHELGRGHVRDMAEALPPASEGDSGSVAAFAAHARAYAALLRQHIQKEEGVLYPMAERLFSQEDDEQLMAAFEAIERDEIGEGVRETGRECAVTSWTAC
jgi:hemerythrin-like domain-containing protein